MTERRWRLTIRAVVALAGSALWAYDGGSISGTVTDPHARAVVGATITAAETTTGVKRTIATDVNGYFSYQNLPVGKYDIRVDSPGFRTVRHTGIVLDVDSKIILDTMLTLGESKETVTVSASAARVETADTQLGEVITGKQITAVPLNGRSFTDLLALQAGVVPVTSITSDTTQDVGVGAFSPSGDLNPGTMSINGQREFANSFAINGSDVEEDVNMGAAIIPNLDAIAEFRILTSNFDAEYGEFSGGQIEVVTKSGSNSLHGDVFEFLRNTNLDARNYFSSSRGAFDQNQFGATLGGPIRRNTVFFFADYQGTRLTRGVDTGDIPVPSAQDRTGNLADLASSFSTVDQNGKSVPTTVSGSYWAGLLSQRLGYGVTAGEPYYFPGCRSSAQCVLPNAVIPASAWSAPARSLLKYIPAANNANGTFSSSAYNENLRDDKGANRIDASTRLGMLSAYYFLDDWSQNNPYPVAQGGANVPGFNALNLGRAQLFTSGDTKTFDSTAVNEFHFSILRDATRLGQPIGGCRRQPRVARLRGRSVNARDCSLIAGHRGRGKRGLQQLLDRHEHERVAAGEQHFSVARRLLQNRGRAHHQIRRGVPLRSGEYQSNRSIEWQLHLLRERDGRGLRGLPVGHPQPIQPEPVTGLLRSQQVCRNLRPR
jgi:hypothetical protein